MRNIALTLAAAALVVGCSLETTDPVENLPPQVKLINASPATAALSVHLDANPQPMTAPLGFKETSDCLLVLPAMHAMAFLEENNTRGTVTRSFERNTHYTAILTNAGSAFRAAVLADDATVPSEMHGLRFINATGLAGDVYVTAPGDAPAPPFLTAGNLAPFATMTSGGEYVFRNESHTRVRLFDVGATTNPRADLSLAALNVDRLATIIFTERQNPEDPGAFQVNACQ